MKLKFVLLGIILSILALTALNAQNAKSNRLFIDVHLLHPGSIKKADVAAAHTKDLAVQSKYGVKFLKYWVDEKTATVYCLSSALDSAHIAAAHNEAHGLLPNHVYAVTDGTPAKPLANVPYFLDIHNLGAGNVTAEAVAGAHKKDLAVQRKHKVNFINYWVCEERGMVFCLSQTPDQKNVADTHKEAHGLMPTTVMPVLEGQ